MADDETTPPDGQDPKDGKDGKDGKTSTPPWGSDDKFDPERAWRLIENLREEREALKTERDTFKTKATEHERSQMSEVQRLEAERDELRQERDRLAGQVARYKVAVEKELPKDLIEFLPEGASEEDLVARADTLLTRFNAASSTPSDDKGGSTETPARPPRERLRPGAAPDDNGATDEETDLSKIGAKLFAS